MEKLYTGIATSIGGRNGKVKSSDESFELELRTPKEMGGTEGLHTNPEQLFAAGYSACFNGALMMVSSQKRIIVAPKITVKASLWKDDVSGFSISAVIDVVIPGVEQSVAEELAAAAHAVCPYSKAIKGNVDVELNVSTK